LVHYVAPGTSNKNAALSQIVRQEFSKNRNVTDAVEIQNLQANAIRALSNYLLFQNSSADPKLKQAVKKFHDRHLESVRAKPEEKGERAER